LKVYARVAGADLGDSNHVDRIRITHSLDS
jgi:hypothetical protein